MKKGVMCTIFFCMVILKIYSQEEALVLQMNIGDEIWLDGEVVIFNGWPPNIRIKISNNYIVGINEKNVPKIITKNIASCFIKGTFKLKFIYFTGIPYYKNKLMVFKIIEYKNIDLIEK